MAEGYYIDVPTCVDLLDLAADSPQDLCHKDWMIWRNPLNGRTIFHEIVSRLRFHHLLPRLLSFLLDSNSQEFWDHSADQLDDKGDSPLAICVRNGFLIEGRMLLAVLDGRLCHGLRSQCPFGMLFHNEAMPYRMETLIYLTYYRHKGRLPGTCTCVDVAVAGFPEKVECLKDASATIDTRRESTIRTGAILVGLLRRSTSSDLFVNVMIPELKKKWARHLEDSILGSYSYYQEN